MTDAPPPRRRLIDLTRPLDETLEVYAEPGYSDPPFVVEDWCSVAERGFKVSRLQLGTQTGTHIDAPAHFLDGGAALDALDPAALIGPYRALRPADWVDAAAWQAATARHRGEGILFLLGVGPSFDVPQAALDAFLSLDCPVWATTGEVDIPDAAPLEFHRLLARAGVYLIEDLDRTAIREVPDTGEMIALPLRLTGTSGSPCRVLVRTGP